MPEQQSVNSKPDFAQFDTARADIRGPVAVVEGLDGSHQEMTGAVDYLEFSTPAEYWGWVESHKTIPWNNCHSTSLGGNHDKSSQ